ncbi:hypothetical protein C8J56DRAFT_1019384 [Mycena floridula]|nr:hypothetical protein C8J56DRAFT_1019384 [Mycena floridula]
MPAAVPSLSTPSQTTSYLTPPSLAANPPTDEKLQPKTIQLMVGAFVLFVFVIYAFTRLGYHWKLKAPRIQRPAAVINLGRLAAVRFGRVAPIGFDGRVTATVALPLAAHTRAEARAYPSEHTYH